MLVGPTPPPYPATLADRARLFRRPRQHEGTLWFGFGLGLGLGTPTLALARAPHPERGPSPRHYEEALYVFEQQEEMRNRSLWRPRFTPVSFSLLLTACAEVGTELTLP